MPLRSLQAPDRSTSRSLAVRRLADPLVVTLVVLVAVGLVVAVVRPSPSRPALPLALSSGDWAPYVGSDLPGGGPLTELVTGVLREVGYEPEVRFTTWQTAQFRADRGETVGVFPLVASAERRERFVLSEPLMEFEYVLFHRVDDAPTVERPADLDGLRVARIAGYDYWTELEDAVDTFVPFETSIEAFRALAAGEVDLVPEGLLPGQAVLTDPDFAADATDFSFLDDGPLTRSIEGLHFMLPRTAEAEVVLPAFDGALAELKATEEYADVLARVGAGVGFPEVTLTPFGDLELVELLDADGGVLVLSPRGTRAQVLSWPGGLLEPTTGGSTLVEVKVLNGPAVGRLVRVDARAVVLG